MPTHIVLATYTDQGILGVRTTREAAQRREAVRQRLERFGGRELSLSYTQGRYDLVATVEFPDEAAATAFLLETGAQGNVRTETLRAFSPAEMEPVWERPAAR